MKLDLCVCWCHRQPNPLRHLREGLRVHRGGCIELLHEAYKDEACLGQSKLLPNANSWSSVTAAQGQLWNDLEQSRLVRRTRAAIAMLGTSFPISPA